MKEFHSFNLRFELRSKSPDFERSMDIIMIIIEVAGGLGNQLQQYALSQKFLSLGVEAKLDLSWFDKQAKNANLTPRKLELDFFDGLEYEVCTKAEKQKLLGQDNICGRLKRKLFPDKVRFFQETEMFHPEILEFTSMYLSGYFACEKYYADILPLLREKIRFMPSKDKRNQQAAHEIKNCESVAVHIRRSDYLKPENQKLFGNICTEGYYKAAIDHISQRTVGAHFYFFSDDTHYVKDNYQADNYSYVDWNKGDQSLYDMYLMSQCKHIICANSTFSFWGARLNANPGKIMIRPARHKNTWAAPPEILGPLWPGWVLVESDGQELYKDC